MTFTPTDYNPYDFANRRHIGPSPSEMEEMLAAVGVRSLDELIDETVPASIRQTTPLAWAPLAEHELLAKMREVGGEEPGDDQPDRAGLLRHGDAPGDPAQHPGEPGLVHGLHALSARDRPGAAGGAAELSRPWSAT